MAVFTFSTKSRKPSDEELVRRVKERCAKEGRNFSALVVSQLRKWEKEQETQNG